MQNIAIINELIKQGRPGTQDLYSKIPFFMRTRLDGIIQEQLWTKVSEGCQQNDQSSLDCAKRIYRQVLQAVDAYIDAYTKKPGTDNCILMMMDKNRIMNEFHDDAAAFVREMDNCLQREKELVFTFREMEQTEPELAVHNEVISDQSDDANITLIERLTQEVGSQLLQAKSPAESITRYFNASQELMATLSPGNISDSSSEDDIRHNLAELDNLDLNYEQAMMQFVTCKEAVVTGMNQLSILCSHYANKLTEDLATWKIAEAKRSVKVGPETNTGALLNKAQRFGAALNTILTWFNNGDIQSIHNSQLSQDADQVFFMEVGRIHLDFQTILKSLIQIVVTVQPKGVISIENKGKKDSPNYCTKKTQPFSSTVRVLAAESFPSFHILSKDVELVAEKDLAQESRTAVVGKDGGRCLKVEALNGNNLPEIQFNIEVKNFCRVEQNNVYKQFFRLVYKVRVSVLGTEYLLQTMSLPFTFNTGANQILEHMGARMWYCASVRDLNSGFQCPDPLSVDEVINILDNRIAYIGSKTRRLTAQEKVFLRGRLPVVSDDTVTMQGFLKDKMKTLRDEEPLNYSFYTWFYSVIHSIESLLLNAWQDGIIYGFCSEKTAEEILMNPNTPEGSFLLRPSVSEIKKTSSAEATAALVMEVKLRKGTAHPFDGHSSEYQVTSIPLFYKHIEKNTLYGAIRGIEFNHKPVAKFLYGREGGRKLDVLKGYVKKQKEKHYPEYRMLMEKIEKINIRHSAKPTAAAAEEASDRENESGQETNKRKRRYRKSSSNTQIQSNSQSPSMSLGSHDSPTGSAATLPVFSSLSSPEVKQETPTHVQFQSGGAVNEQCQRSGTQGKTIAGTSDEEAVNGNAGEQENNLLDNEVVFGDIRMDISNIAHLASSHRSPHGQDCYPAANGSGTAGIDVTNSLPTQFQYNQQQGNGLNNNCFMESAGSHGYNHGFDNSDKSSLDADFPIRNLSPASVKSNFSESLPSPAGNAHISSPRANMQLTENLPTVLNDAKEVKRRGRKQGGSKGNSQNNSGKKSTTSLRSTVKPVVHIPHGDHSPSLSFQISHVNLQNPNYAVYLGAESCSDPEMGNSLNQYSTINLDNLDDTQLVNCILQQRAGMQLSPDSGVGDQSPSPESIWMGGPFSNGFHTGSNMPGITDLSHLIFLPDSNILDTTDLSHV